MASRTKLLTVPSIGDKKGNCTGQCDPRLLPRHERAINRAMRWLRDSFLGLHLTLLALAMQLAAGSLVISPLLLTQADPTICHADAAHGGGQMPTVPYAPPAVCPILLAIGLTTPVLAAPPAVPPTPQLVAWRAEATPPARAPPLYRVDSAKPRGPPVQV